MPANGRRGRPQGKCHRKQTARLRPGKGERVRQERTAPPATGAARQTPPGARPNRGGRRNRYRDNSLGCGGRGGGPAPPPGLAARGAPRGASERNGRPIPVIHGDGQNPAYRPPGAPSPTACPQDCPPAPSRFCLTKKRKRGKGGCRASGAVVLIYGTLYLARSTIKSEALQKRTYRLSNDHTSPLPGSVVPC